MPTTCFMSLFRAASNRPASVSPADAGVEGVELLQSEPTTRHRSGDHHSAPYLGRFHVPGHKGGVGTDSSLLEALGEDTLSLDIPMIINGIDVGTSPTSVEEAQAMAADAWGSKRTWFLTNGATQGNQATCLALAQLGGEVVVQRNAHASTIDGLVLAGLRPIFVGPELNPDLGIAHCVTPQSLELALADSRGAVAAMVVSPTYFGAVADVRLEESTIDRALTLGVRRARTRSYSRPLDAARRHAVVAGPAALDESISAVAATRAAVGQIPGLEVLDRAPPAPSRSTTTTRCGWPSTCGVRERPVTRSPTRPA